MDHGKMVARLLQDKKVPKVNENGTDILIHECWYGEYGSVRSLELEVIRLSRDIQLGMAKAMPKEEY